MTSSRTGLLVLGAGGMDLAIARRLGAGKLVILADYSPKVLDSAVSSLRNDGHEVETHIVDVSSNDSVKNLAKVASGAARLNTVVNTAGISPGMGTARKIFEVNLLGTANVIDAFLEVMSTMPTKVLTGIRHLRGKHNLDANGPIQKKRRLTFNGDTSIAGPIEQALVNQRISDFSPERFKTTLLRQMAYANISFRQGELKQFHELLQEAYAEIGTAGCLPTAHTLVSWIKRDFHHYKAVVVEQLQELEGHIHFTFDLWTAGNLLSLNGVFAHFLDPIGKKKKILLSIPSINGNHTGEAIADGVGEIIKEFGLEKRVGYFVLDNAGNNNTGVQALGRMFGFNPSKRRLRCTAHIVNFVATQIMYGEDLRAFETEGDAPRALQDDLELWRRKGALGKLRNIIMWITDRRAGGGRAGEFKALKIESQNCLLDDEPCRPPAELKRPNDTRWNSHYYAFETAVLNRAPIDAYSEKEERAHNTRLDRVTQKNRRLEADKHIKFPAKPMIVEDKMSTEDWVTVTRYMEILKPLMLVTKKLEGYPRQGRNGLMWEVLPCYEFLLNHLERLMEQYRHDPDEDLKLNIQLGR
ncbi:hypothetical protein BFJ70_g16721 [Fusarium oxysporum]|nr:hypothetical protein BFJ70_g16721 [Fusarium oxysporum]